MASQVSRRSRSTDSRAAAAISRSGDGLLGNKHTQILLGASVGILALTLVFTTSGMRGSTRGNKDAQSSSAKKQQKDSAEKVTVKRELPEGVTEDQVPKWVPYRQPSGRTELEAWNSVDADTARDPYFRQDIMAPKESRTLFPASDTEAFGDEPAGPPEQPQDDENLGEDAAASAELEQAAGLPEEEPSSALAAEDPVAPPPVDASETTEPAEATG